MRNLKPVVIAAVAAAAVTGCATTPADPGLPYIATYRPLSAAPGELRVSGAAALAGRLTVSGGCIALEPEDGPTRLIAFAPRVRATRSGDRIGIVNDRSGARAWVGESISVGGSAPPDPAVFISQRFTTPPPAACPADLFVSSSSFARR